MFKCCRELCPRLSDKGISLIALIITIIVIIILAVIILGVAINTPEKAKLASYISDLSSIKEAVALKRSTNLIPKTNGSEPDVNEGFVKIKIKRTADSVAEDAWVINLDILKIKNSTYGNGYEDIIENSEITFGADAPDIYVYDANGEVFYAKGYKDKEVSAYSINDATNLAEELKIVKATNPSDWEFDPITGVISGYNGDLTVTELIIPNYINDSRVIEIKGDRR